MAKKVGKYTIEFENKPTVVGYGSVVGKMEHEGPLSEEFDELYYFDGDDLGCHYTKD